MNKKTILVIYIISCIGGIILPYVIGDWCVGSSGIKEDASFVIFKWCLGLLMLVLITFIIFLISSLWKEINK